MIQHKVLLLKAFGHFVLLVLSRRTNGDALIFLQIQISWDHSFMCKETSGNTVIVSVLETEDELCFRPHSFVQPSLTLSLFLVGLVPFFFSLKLINKQSL